MRAITPASPPVRWDARVLTVAGLPLHPLVVHAVVVLLPLAAIGTVTVAVRPALRRTLGIPVLLVALAGTVAVPSATLSGQRLRASMGGGSPLVAEHAARAPALLPAAALFVVLAGLAVVAGIVTAALVVWIGHAGAGAVWS